jgi:hypothetical protein
VQHHAERALVVRLRLLLRRQRPLQLGDRREAQARRELVLPRALRDLELVLRLLELALRVLNLLQALAFWGKRKEHKNALATAWRGAAWRLHKIKIRKRTRLPHRRQRTRLLPLHQQVVLHLRAPLHAEDVRLLLQALQFDLRGHDLAVERLQFVGLRLLREPQRGRRLVHEVDRLVREVAVGDVARGVDGGCGRGWEVRDGCDEYGGNATACGAYR